MKEFIHHTIQVISEKEDVLLVIKPHPNELRKEVVTPSEYFVDLLPSNLPENVLLLKNRWLNLSDFVQFIDLGLIWHGTSALELIAQGVPVVVGSHTGNKDHPIDFLKPIDRQNYAEIITSGSIISVSPDLRDRAALLLAYLGSDQIMIPYPYANMQFLRKVDIGQPQWFMDKVEHFLEQGDPYIAEIVRRVL